MNFELSFSDVLSDSPQFRENIKSENEGFQKFASKMGSFVKAITDVVATLQKLTAAERIAKEKLFDLAEQTNDDLQQSIFTKFFDFNSCLDQSRSEMMQLLERVVISKASASAKLHVSAVKDLMHNYEKAKSNADNVVAKRSSVKKTSEKSETTDIQYSQILKSYQNTALNFRSSLYFSHEMLKLETSSVVLSYLVYHEKFIERMKDFFSQNHQFISDSFATIEENQSKLNLDIAKWESEVSTLMSTTKEKKQPLPTSLKELTVISGYLFMRGNNRLQSWKRRFFEVKDGNLVYYKKKKDAPTFSVSLLLTTFKFATSIDRRYCFEVISPLQKTLTLQADSEAEMKKWITVLTNAKEELITQADHSSSPRSSHSHSNAHASANALLSNGAVGSALSKSLPMPGASANSSSHTPNSNNEVAENPLTKGTVLLNLLRKKDISNCYCADCGAKDPDWAVINLGVLVCIDCSGAHRKLGVHISKVRSLKLDALQPEIQLMMLFFGNRTLNEILEAGIDEKTNRIHENSELSDRIRWIKMKYQDRKMLKDDKYTNTDKSKLVFKFIKDGNILGLLNFVLWGFDFNASFPYGLIPLHEAVRAENVIVMTFLLMNGANINLTDLHGNTCLHIACAKKNRLLVAVLLRSGINYNAANEDGQTAEDIAKLEDSKSSENHLLSCRVLIKLYSSRDNTMISATVKESIMREFKSHEENVKTVLYDGLKKLIAVSEESDDEDDEDEEDEIEDEVVDDEKDEED